VGALEVLARIEVPVSDHTSYARYSARELADIALRDGARMLTARLEGELARYPAPLLVRAAALAEPRFFRGPPPPAYGDANSKLTVEEKGQPVELEARIHYGEWTLYRNGEARSLPLRLERWDARPPSVAADLDGDGVPELLLPGDIVRAVDGYYDAADVGPVPEEDMNEESGC
jgi:hypothetical protein